MGNTNTSYGLIDTELSLMRNHFIAALHSKRDMPGFYCHISISLGSISTLSKVLLSISFLSGNFSNKDQPIEM